MEMSSGPATSIKEHAGKNIHWESAASPLVEGGAVFVAVGGPGESLLAFDKKDGHVLWKAESEKLTQSTPVAATILDTRQVIFFTQSGLVSVAPTTGAVSVALSLQIQCLHRHLTRCLRRHR